MQSPGTLSELIRPSCGPAADYALPVFLLDCSADGLCTHETGRHKATGGGKSNTEAPHGLPCGRHTLVLRADLGSQQSSQKAIRLVLQHLAMQRSGEAQQPPDMQLDEFREQRWGDVDLARCKWTCS